MPCIVSRNGQVEIDINYNTKLIAAIRTLNSSPGHRYYQYRYIALAERVQSACAFPDFTSYCQCPKLQISENRTFAVFLQFHPKDLPLLSCTRGSRDAASTCEVLANVHIT